MVLTGHELTAASSAVAVLAIVGGYLGVKSANRNALKIAREERSSRRRDELNDLKRATYARFLAALTVLAAASREQEAIVTKPEIRGEARIAAIKKRTDAVAVARNIAAELDLLASDLLRRLVGEALQSASLCNRENEQVYAQEVPGSELLCAMICKVPKCQTLKSWTALRMPQSPLFHEMLRASIQLSRHRLSAEWRHPALLVPRSNIRGLLPYFNQLDSQLLGSPSGRRVMLADSSIS